MEIDDGKRSPSFDCFAFGKLKRKEWFKERERLNIETEVDRYLLDPREDLTDDEFDLLAWWKSNSRKCPKLSEIARDVLALPISTIGSETAFNIEGRFLDTYRSAFSTCSPMALEALLCTQS